MGEVYRAHDARLAREVAIKVLPEALAKDSDRLQRFGHEARTLGALSHPNLLAIFDVGAKDGLKYLVSELPKISILVSRRKVRCIFCGSAAQEGRYCPRTAGEPGGCGRCARRNLVRRDDSLCALQLWRHMTTKIPSEQCSISLAARHSS